MRLIRPAACLALAGLAASGSLALAAEAPTSSVTSTTLFLAQEGCGSTAEPGRLEPKAQSDGADGCGVIGGLPLNEVIVQDGGAETVAEEYASTNAMTPVKIDHAKKVTGQVSAGSWFATGIVPAGGVGTVTFTVGMVGSTTAGKSINFGTVTVSAPAAPGKDIVEVPFSLAIPATAKGAKLKSFVLSVAQHGANFGMSAKSLSGTSYVVIPAKK